MIALAIIAALQVADVTLTTLILRVGGQELNPAMRWLMEGGADWDLDIAERTGIKAMAAMAAGAPPSARAFATPTSDPGAGRYWVTKNSTQVVVNFNTAVGSNVTFDVEAFL